MTLSQESIHRKFWYPDGKKRIESLLNLYETQLQFVEKYHSSHVYGSMNPKWIELTSKIEVCRNLLKWIE